MIRIPRALTILLHCAALAAALSASVAAADAGPSREKAVFASPAPGSAVGLLCEVIKEKKLDEHNGLLLEVKYFDPAATEQAVILRRVDAGMFPVISAARVNLIGEKIRLFAPALINRSRERCFEPYWMRLPSFRPTPRALPKRTGNR